MLSAVSNCKLTVGASNPVNHPRTSTDSDFGDPPEITKNQSKFLPLPVRSKTRKSEPRVTKSLPKWSPKPSPGHLNLKLSANCKSNKKYFICYVLGTSRHRVLVPCPLPNHKKNTLESTLQLGGPNYQQVVKMTPKWVPWGSRNPSKIH